MFSHHESVRGRPRRLAGWSIFLLALAWLGLLATSAFAHGGEDHGDEAKPVAAAAAAPRITAQSETYELVGTLKGQRLTLYLDRFADNVPVTDAGITVTLDGAAITAEPQPDGAYAVTSPRFGSGGTLDLVFTVTGGAGDDLLIGSLALPAPGQAASIISPRSLLTRAQDLTTSSARALYLTSLATLMLGLVLGLALRSRSFVLPVAATIGLLTLLVAGAALSHEGHEDGPAAATPMADTPQRLPDGGLFVPKPTQRILDLRTVLTRPESAVRSVSLMGRVIADPNRSGLVQSINGGRVIAPDSGLPQLGRAVKKGEVLARIERPIISADQATLAEKVGDIEQQTALAESRLVRSRRLADQGAAPRVNVTDAELELEGLRRRRAAVREIGSTPEVLTAPIDGVIATAKVVAGQVVQAQDILFQVVDPHSLWVEALVYNGAAPSGVAGATALAPDGATLKLAFQGASRALQQQATVIQFAMLDPPDTVSLGQPVTVLAPSGAPVSGIILPREAVVRGGGGEAQVWRHTGPERFEARPVRATAFDASRVVIEAGLGEGERIVVRGAELINQIR